LLLVSGIILHINTAGRNLGETTILQGAVDSGEQEKENRRE